MYKNRRHPTEAECRLLCCPILLSRCRFCSFLKLLSYRHTPKGAAFFALVQLAMALLLLWGRSQLAGLEGLDWLRLLLLILAVGDLVTIPAVWIVLKQRMKEIEGGELDAARKY